jgi:hypothetical protein
MTPTEALAVAERKPWERIIIIGFTEDSDGVACISSHMPRETALWIVEFAKLHVMGRL